MRAHVVWLRFRDGTCGEIDLAPALRGQIRAPLKDPRFFSEFTIRPEFHTLVWPNGADFAPEFLHDNVRVETVAEHPWAALAIGTWLLIMVAVVLSALKECVATLATGKRAPEPDWRAMSRMHDAWDVPKRARRSRGRETRAQNMGDPKT